MTTLKGQILTLPKMSGSVSSPQTLGGNIGAKTINIGEDGATFIPSVSDDGVISWTNDKDLPNPDPVNIKGDPGKNGYTPIKGIDYFDGKDGINGKNGYTPVKGKDYFDGKDGKNGIDGTNGKDGYTPVKGVDYFDGKNGIDGKDGKDGVNGVTPHVGSNGNWFIGGTDTGIPATGPAGKQGLPGTPGKDGSDGKDGISTTHSWNGTTLTVTSASGTSSANLKGDKGDTGPAYTLTDTDKANIVSSVVASLPVYHGEVVEV